MCEYQFHGVTRTENGDGTVTLTLEGWSYPTGAELRAGTTKPSHTESACMTRTVPARWSEWEDEPVRVIESEDAAAMVAEHIGGPYTPIWQGKGWTVELQSGYPLWQTTS